MSWRGGLLSAIIGPQLVKITAESMVVPFLGTYFGVIILNLIGMWLFALLRHSAPGAGVAQVPRRGAQPQPVAEGAGDCRGDHLRARSPMR